MGGKDPFLPSNIMWIMGKMRVMDGLIDACLHEDSNKGDRNITKNDRVEGKWLKLEKRWRLITRGKSGKRSGEEIMPRGSSRGWGELLWL